MSIAICFYGLHSGKNDKNETIEYKLALNSIKKHIINFNKNKKCDIFFTLGIIIIIIIIIIMN